MSIKSREIALTTEELLKKWDKNIILKVICLPGKSIWAVRLDGEQIKMNFAQIPLSGLLKKLSPVLAIAKKF